jgi:hypothetical protein
MLTTANFLTIAQVIGILTVVCGALSVLGFLLKWGIRFRLVGITGFMGVLTGGLFALSLVPFTRTAIPGAVHYLEVYDNGGPQVVIAVPPQITESQLDATLRQAAADLFSYGRVALSQTQMTIRARTTVHPAKGVSEPLYLGEAKRSLSNREDDQLAIEIYHDKFAKLPPANA